MRVTVDVFGPFLALLDCVCWALCCWGPLLLGGRLLWGRRLPRLSRASWFAVLPVDMAVVVGCEALGDEAGGMATGCGRGHVGRVCMWGGWRSFFIWRRGCAA